MKPDEFKKKISLIIGKLGVPVMVNNNQLVFLSLHLKINFMSGAYTCIIK